MAVLSTGTTASSRPTGNCQRRQTLHQAEGVRWPARRHQSTFLPHSQATPDVELRGNIYISQTCGFVTGPDFAPRLLGKNSLIASRCEAQLTSV